MEIKYENSVYTCPKYITYAIVVINWKKILITRLPLIYSIYYIQQYPRNVIVEQNEIEYS